MEERSRIKAARRAGVDPYYIDRLVELGILRPGSRDALSPGDVRRARRVRSLERTGVSLDGIAATLRQGTLSLSFLDVTVFDRFAPLTDTTFRELSERTGVPLDLLYVVREAIGFAEPRPDDLVREDELSVAQAIELQLSNGFRPAVIEGWLRVCEDSLRRITETETDSYGTEVVRPLLQSGMNEAEMLEAQAKLGAVIAPAIERATLAMYHGRQDHPGARRWSSTWKTRSTRPACSSGCTIRRRWSSSTSPGTRG